MYIWYTDPNTSQWVPATNLPGSGILVQTAYAETTTWTSGSAAMAGGTDTIPQQTDGTQILTVSITPKSSTNKLIVHVSGQFALGTAPFNIWTALFQDATANAFASKGLSCPVADNMVPMDFTAQITAGTTSSTTIKLRMGNLTGNSATYAVNGYSSGRRLGGSQRVILFVEEVSG